MDRGWRRSDRWILGHKRDVMFQGVSTRASSRHRGAWLDGLGIAEIKIDGAESRAGDGFSDVEHSEQCPQGLYARLENKPTRLDSLLARCSPSRRGLGRGLEGAPNVTLGGGKGGFLVVPGMM
jgi:hypothetical protein